MLKLGILYHKGQMVNHRSLVKVLFNPLLRIFGFCIGTNVNLDTGEVYGICLFRCEKLWPRLRDLKPNEHDFILKKRILI